MGSENHEVVDVSSDEEVDPRGDRDYLSWLNKVVDVKSDSTDLVSVDSQLNSSTQANLEDDDDDGDCVILDSDPEKTSAGVEAKADDDDEEEEVLVVGQKGEIACRDVPHPRHSCAKYSFNSTSHESYCDMCHCYVCDIPAPCPYRCVALASTDHCHANANDKDKTWKNQREYFRIGNMPLPTQPAHATTVSPPPSIIRLSQNRNKIEIRPCSNCVANLSNVRVRQHSHGLQSLSIQKDRSSYLGHDLVMVVVTTTSRWVFIPMLKFLDPLTVTLLL